MTRKEMMETVNSIIDELMYCDDEEFVDRITYAIYNGEQFTEDEIDAEEDWEYRWKDDDDDDWDFDDDDDEEDEWEEE